MKMNCAPVRLIGRSYKSGLAEVYNNFGRLPLRAREERPGTVPIWARKPCRDRRKKVSLGSQRDAEVGSRVQFLRKYSRDSCSGQDDHQPPAKDDGHAGPAF